VTAASWRDDMARNGWSPNPEPPNDNKPTWPELLAIAAILFILYILLMLDGMPARL
jgi:hypothetical protein